MEIALVITSVMSISFLIAYLSVSHKLSVVNKGFAQLFLAFDAVKGAVEANPTKTEDDIHKENFIKFLSDSRDWAYEYIEDVQKALTKFVKEVEPQLEYYNKYGIVIDGMVPPHDFALKKISKEFDELKKLLPEDTSDRR